MTQLTRSIAVYLAVAAAATSAVYAQGPSQAAMVVTARVMGGAYAAADTPARLTLQEPQLYSGIIGSVSLPCAADQTIYILSGSVIQLASDRGAQFDLQVASERSVGRDGIHYSIVSKGIKRRGGANTVIPNGAYSGSLTTQIVYL